MALGLDNKTGAIVADDGFNLFWTAFDPLDVESGSIDPMGFLRGYLALADRLLPGMTTVTGVPRYASMICAGAAVANAQVPPSPDLRGAKLRQKRLTLLKAYERAWALACGLAARDSTVGQVAIEGVRGVRYVKRKLDSLAPNTKYIRSSSFNLLSNQVRYGGIGIYSAFLESCHLLTSADLSLRPSGEDLAEAFPAPPTDVIAHDEEAPMSLASLAAWGAEAHPKALTRIEGRRLAEALAGGGESEWNDEIRWSMLKLLAEQRTASDRSEKELLRAVLANLKDVRGAARLVQPGCANQLRAVLTIVEPYETFYQSALFLFLAIQAAVTDGSTVSLAQVATAPSVGRAVATATRASRDLVAALKRAPDLDPTSAKDIGNALRDAGIEAFVEQLADAATTEDVLAVTLSRHEGVQTGKFDGGVRKASWIKRTSSHTLRLAAQRFRLDKRNRPSKWSEVGTHPYRTDAAFSFIDACGNWIQ